MRDSSGSTAPRSDTRSPNSPDLDLPRVAPETVFSNAARLVNRKAQPSTRGRMHVVADDATVIEPSSRSLREAD